MPELLAVIKALQGAETNRNAIVKQVRDDHDRFRKATQGTANAINTDVRQTTDSLGQSSKRVGDMWTDIRKHIISSDQMLVGAMAALGYGAGSGIAIFTPEVDGTRGRRGGPDSDLLDGTLNSTNKSGRITDINSVKPTRGYDEGSVVMRRTRSVSAEATKLAANSPYATLLNAAVELLDFNTALGIIAIAAVLAGSVASLDLIARADSDKYDAQASLGRNSLNFLSQLIRRGVNPERGSTANLNNLDDFIWSPRFNSQASGQYDGNPLSTTNTASAARYMQDGY